MPTVDIEKLANMVDARIYIAFGDFEKEANEILTGVITGEFTVGGSNEFKSLFQLSAQQTLQSLLSTVGALLNRQDIAQLRVGTVSQTLQTWVSSSIPSFTVPMAFLATQPDDDVRKQVRVLGETVYPTFSGDGSGIVHPPLGYTVLGSNKAKNTLLVQIGNWFKAPGQIMKSISFTFSKEVHENGTPLFAIGTIEFSPFRLIDAKTFKQYLNTNALGKDT